MGEIVITLITHQGINKNSRVQFMISRPRITNKILYTISINLFYSLYSKPLHEFIIVLDFHTLVLAQQFSLQWPFFAYSGSQ